MAAQNNRGRIFEEEMASDLSPRGILSGPRNWGQAVPSEGMVQGIPRSGPQQVGKAQVSDGGVGHRGTRLGIWARPDGKRPCKHHLSAQQFVKFPSLSFLLFLMAKTRDCFCTQKATMSATFIISGPGHFSL